MSDLEQTSSAQHSSKKKKLFLIWSVCLTLAFVFYLAWTSSRFKPQEIDLSQEQTVPLTFTLPVGYEDDLNEQEKQALTFIKEMNKEGCNELEDPGLKQYCLTQVQNYLLNKEGKCDLILWNLELRNFCQQENQKKTSLTDSNGKENILYNQNYFDEVLSDLENVAEEEKSEPQILLAKAVTYAQKGSIEFSEEENAEKAIELTKEVLVLDPKNSDALYIQGYSNEIMENYDEALKLYDQALEINPQNAGIISQKGHAYKLMGELEKARELFEKALEIDQNQPHALANLANIYLGENKTEQAVSMYKDVISLSKNARLKAEAAYALSSIYTFSEDYVLAEEFINQTITFDPAFDLGYIGLGRLQFLQAFQADLTEEEIGMHLTDSFNNLIFALNLNAEKTLAYYQLGLQYSVLEEDEKAQEMFEMALSVVDTDITLSVTEKDAMRQEIQSHLKQ